jgi:hypothetical protein
VYVDGNVHFLILRDLGHRLAAFLRRVASSSSSQRAERFSARHLVLELGLPSCGAVSARRSQRPPDS